MKKIKITKSWFIWIALVDFVIIFALIGIFSPRQASRTNNNIPAQEKAESGKDYVVMETADPYVTKVVKKADQITKPILDHKDPSIGEQNTPVTLVLYSDFTCQYCNEEEKNILEIIKDYKGKVNLIRKDYPDNIKTSLSYLSSLAGRCAHQQGKFWEFNEILINAKLEKKEQLYGVAHSANLDEKNFRECLDKSKTDNEIQANIKEADRLSITGTPMLYVNNNDYLGILSKEEIKEIIDKELKK